MTKTNAASGTLTNDNERTARFDRAVYAASCEESGTRARHASTKVLAAFGKAMAHVRAWARLASPGNCSASGSGDGAADVRGAEARMAVPFISHGGRRAATQRTGAGLALLLLAALAALPSPAQA